MGLPSQSTERHRDVVEAEIERTEVFHALLASLAKTMGDEQSELRGARRPAGWSLDALLPYLLRDWTGAPEFEALAERIGTAVGSMFPQACDKSLVFAACGAAGLLTRVGAEFGRVLGFDLALPMLGAARHLLDGQTLELRLPRAIDEPGRIRLGEGRLEPASRNVRLVAMDALDTALPAGSVDCFVTAFMTDLLPEPRRLALEIHRALRDDGIWINYGPSGPLTALWRFDQPEAAGFMADAGFSVLASSAYRTTYLDLTVHCPRWSFQNHVCYLTTASKSGRPKPLGAAAAPPPWTALRDLVPRHFPGAAVVERRGLGDDGASSTDVSPRWRAGAPANLGDRPGRGSNPRSRRRQANRRHARRPARARGRTDLRANPSGPRRMDRARFAARASCLAPVIGRSGRSEAERYPEHVDGSPGTSFACSGDCARRPSTSL